MAKTLSYKGGGGEISGEALQTAPFAWTEKDRRKLAPGAVTTQQSNSSVVFGDRLILKIFRKLDEGPNPEVEMGRFLTERANFPHTAPLVGVLEYRKGRSEPYTLGVLQKYVRNEGDAWRFTLDELSRYFERVLARPPEKEVPVPLGNLLDLMIEDLPPLALETIGPYIEHARLLGQRTAELHLALACDPDDPAFRPEPFSPFLQNSLFQSFRNLTGRVMRLLSTRCGDLPKELQAEAQKVMSAEAKIMKYFRRIKDQKITAAQIRCHGDFHLGQILYTGKDFVINDCEGEPARSVSARMLKRSPFKDVAGMLRSFNYASQSSLRELVKRGVVSPEKNETMKRWAAFWNRWVSAAYLKSYLTTSGKAVFIPQARRELEILLGMSMMEKAIYELGYELNNRPDWVKFPLEGINELLGDQ